MTMELGHSLRDYLNIQAIRSAVAGLQSRDAVMLELQGELTLLGASEMPSLLPAAVEVALPSHWIAEIRPRHCGEYTVRLSE